MWTLDPDAGLLLRLSRAKASASAPSPTKPATQVDEMDVESSESAASSSSSSSSTASIDAVVQDPSSSSSSLTSPSTSARLPVLPWLRFDGQLDAPMLRSIEMALCSHVALAPGIEVRRLATILPVLSVSEIELVLRSLETQGKVNLATSRTQCASLFSSALPAGFYSTPSSSSSSSSSVAVTASSFLSVLSPNNQEHTYVFPTATSI